MYTHANKYLHLFEKSDKRDLEVVAWSSGTLQQCSTLRTRQRHRLTCMAVHAWSNDTIVMCNYAVLRQKTKRDSPCNRHLHDLHRREQSYNTSTCTHTCAMAICLTTIGEGLVIITQSSQSFLSCLEQEANQGY